MWRARPRRMRGAASDSDLLESFASDILSDSFTYEDADAVARDHDELQTIELGLISCLQTAYARTYDEPSRNNEGFTIERINTWQKNVLEPQSKL